MGLYEAILRNNSCRMDALHLFVAAIPFELWSQVDLVAFWLPSALCLQCTSASVKGLENMKGIPILDVPERKLRDGLSS